jgi:hypothetical protein
MTTSWSEPGGAAAPAALLSGVYVPAPGERVGVVVSGGNSTAVDFTARYLMMKWASVVRPLRPLIGRMSCGQAERATTRSISARNTT